VTDLYADGSRDRQDADALVIDRYLESILAAHGRGADAAPTLTTSLPDPDVRMAADRLARDLHRVAPSFRFEEALAGRLADAAARMRRPLVAGEDRIAISLARPRPDGDESWTPGVADPGMDQRPVIGRPLLIGGALTSAALSLAGAAYVAWRIRRAPAGPMARAVRAVARTRPA
jgi:hypothetical protein